MKYLITLLATATLLSAADITFRSTATQDAAMAKVVERMNAERAATNEANPDQKPIPAITLEEYYQMLFTAAVNGIVRQERQQEVKELTATIEAAPEQLRTDARDVLEGRKTVTEPIKEEPIQRE